MSTNLTVSQGVESLLAYVLCFLEMMLLGILISFHRGMGGGVEGKGEKPQMCHQIRDYKGLKQSIFQHSLQTHQIRSNKTRHNNKKADRKIESNDSPEVPGRKGDQKFPASFRAVTM